ncbi:MAG: mannose-1-phosphate guanyltransferase, partial [Eggerthellaceae bacterium]|nr:mannose-1-phosphate guanyltransferase [Eggerthellaceae bacterium]
MGSQTHIILLSGGSGSRLWPLSNESRSKQFLKVLRNSSNIPESMVQRTFRKIKEALPEANLLVATGNSQVYSIESQIEGDYDLVVEPERRDTAPAIMLACAKLAFDLGADSNDSVIVLPIDTYADDGYYKSLARLAEAVDERPDGLVLLGIEPTYPSEKYGYIVPVDTVGDIYEVSCFAEKPSEAKAQSLIEKGALWN